MLEAIASDLPGAWVLPGSEVLDILLRHIPSIPSQDVREDHAESYEEKFSSFRE